MSYSNGVRCALDGAAEFYDSKPLGVLVDSALAMVDANDNGFAARAHVKQALLAAKADLYGQMDVVDGDDGPEANEAMRLYGEVEEALYGFEAAA